jgi:transposase
MSLQSRNLKDTRGTEVTVAVEELAERGVRVDYVQVWRFVHARGLSYKKAFFPPNN